MIIQLTVVEVGELFLLIFIAHL